MSAARSCSTGLRIERCLCHGTTFAALAEVARESGARSVAALQEAGADFGHGCGLCHPYVRRTLRTGETVFHEIVTEADEPPKQTAPRQPEPPGRGKRDEAER